MSKRGVGGRAAAAALWQDWHVSPTWRGRNEAQKRSRAAPQGPGFIPGLRLFGYPAWVRMHLRAESLWQGVHVSPTWRGRNEAQKRSRAAPQGPVLFRDSAFVATLRG